MIRNTDRADRVIAFLNRLPLVDGPAVGKRFHVDPWMESWVRDIYEPQRDDGTRLVSNAVLSCARKNAKSYLVAGLLLAHLVGPEAVYNGQIFSAACSRFQAKVVFRMCAKMIRMTPALADCLRVIPSTSTIYVKRSDLKSAGSVYTALSADVAQQHGLGANFFVYDEYGEAKDGELWDVLNDSQQTVASPLAVAISTQNNDPNHPFTKMIDEGLKRPQPHTVVHLHAAPEGLALDDPAGWRAANPALATWKSDTKIAEEALKALSNPAKAQNFRRRYLNQRVSLASTLISAPDWLACLPGGTFPDPNFEPKDAFKFARGERIYLGLDMSKRTDLTALVAVSAEDGSRVKSWFFKPSEMVAEHARGDAQPYDVWASQGWLITPSGRIIDAHVVADTIKSLMDEFEVVALVYDYNLSGDVLARLQDLGVTGSVKRGGDLRLVPWGTGFNDMTKAVEALETSVLNKELISDGNPLLSMCVSHAIVEKNHADYRRFVKNKSTQRIDGAVALSIALALKAFDTNYSPVSAFEDEGFSIMLI